MATPIEQPLKLREKLAAAATLAVVVPAAIVVGTVYAAAEKAVGHDITHRGMGF